jgi:hypothetical protein
VAAAEDWRERQRDTDDSEQVGLQLRANVREQRVEPGCVETDSCVVDDEGPSAAACASAATESSSVTSSTNRTMRLSGGVGDDRAAAYTYAAPRSSSSSTIARPKLRLPPLTSAQQLSVSKCQPSRRSSRGLRCLFQWCSRLPVFLFPRVLASSTGYQGQRARPCRNQLEAERGNDPKARRLTGTGPGPAPRQLPAC